MLIVGELRFLWMRIFTIKLLGWLTAGVNCLYFHNFDCGLVVGYMFWLD